MPRMVATKDGDHPTGHSVFDQVICNLRTELRMAQKPALRRGPL